jgi:hypothetical protein
MPPIKYSFMIVSIIVVLVAAIIVVLVVTINIVLAVTISIVLVVTIIIVVSSFPHEIIIHCDTPVYICSI